MYLAACLQMCGTDDPESNLTAIEAGIIRAASYGASLVATPENSTFLGLSDRKVALAEPLDGPTHQRLSALARLHRVHLLIGSVAERLDEKRCYNTSILYGPNGDILGWYRKLHLFDVDIPGGPRYTESATIAPGDRPVVIPTALGRIGLSICYDLRFPLLYQELVRLGAEVLTVPSAFTLATGKDHWHPLLRARAIECQCYLLAPAQDGRHDAQRHSYGHSLIMDPWGTVLAECGDGPGLCLAEIDPEKVARIRRGMPVQSHRRAWIET